MTELGTKRKPPSSPGRQSWIIAASVGLVVAVVWLVGWTPVTKPGLLALILVAAGCGGAIAYLTNWEPRTKAAAAVAAGVIGLIAAFLAVPSEKPKTGTVAPTPTGISSPPSAAPGPTSSPTSHTPTPVAEASPTPPPSEPTRTPTRPITQAPEPTAPPTRRKGTLVIAPGGDPVDLDAPATDPNWGRDGTTGDGEFDGPTFNGGDVGVYPDADSVFFGSEPVTYMTCLEAPNYAGELTPVGELDKGTSFCVRTSAKRYAKLTVAAEATAKWVRFDVTVWEKS